MRRRNLVIAGVLLLILLAGYLVYHFTVFRVTKTSPNPREFPTFARYVEFHFSHPVKSIESVELNGSKVYGEVEINDRYVRYTHIDNFTKETESTLRLIGVVSNSGRQTDIEYRFTPRYIEFNDLSQEVRQESIEKSSSGQKDDPFFNTYFPIVEDGYEIEYNQNPVSLEGNLYVTFLEEIYNYDTNQQVRLPDNEAEEMRKRVFDYIRSLGGKPEQYEIHYANPYLEQKYNPSREYHEHEN